MLLLLQWFCYFCTILLKLPDNIKGPFISEELIAYCMVVVNIPMLVYFLYDVKSDVQEHLQNLKHDDQQKQDAHELDTLKEAFAYAHT